MKIRIRTYLILVLLFLFVAGNGEVNVYVCAFPQNAGPDEETVDVWQQQLKKYAEIYSLIKTYYPEPYNKEKLFFSSISGFLRMLDPHSYFLDPVSVRSLNEDQQGNYYGIGIRITKYEDRLTVIAPIAGTPAYKLGIMAGDVIAEIEGKDTRNFSLDEAMRMLRGAKGTEVNIKVRREGIPALIPFRIKRAEIPLNSVSYSLALPDEPGIGYISIRTFGNTTARELKENIEQLRQKNKIKALILDLRGNAGGSLRAAVDISDLFLRKGKVIVSVQGRAYKQIFIAKKNGQYEDLPAAVLINRGSASASEIVASAFQHHKRAKIIGSRSWGKGLVQTVNRLSLNTSLALTTAKYYTPDNRCIQREFDERDDYFFFLNNKNYDTDHSIEGGVIPDIYIKPDIHPEPIFNLIYRGIFFKFARHLANSNPTITTEFKANHKIIKKFREFLDKNKITYDANAFKKYPKSIQREIEREVMAHKFSPTEGVKVFLKSDKVTQTAINILKNFLKKLKKK
ncbi:MAG: PDZ domain-containing protein [Candidatus Aminicenantes bacterium]|nr:PDZ domain-containing protein [Candidatus Aminicenantes bacterium]NIM84284.1 PDZ domain-containing protein [Candidatus Aminicenantes bacterium]NIN23770.1 PDZ domain-containing protein [Candidatus Aminicenantes bacterium]NIN47486.1 PDZ domain-containing protein [Candidatus Aminicenantes bacterium]NIN90406.1 PDZ domain-containing protein [Candidatus Aminicenantes bacterium]